MKFGPYIIPKVYIFSTGLETSVISKKKIYQNLFIQLSKCQSTRFLKTDSQICQIQPLSGLFQIRSALQTIAHSPISEIY